MKNMQIIKVSLVLNSSLVRVKKERVYFDLRTNSVRRFLRGLNLFLVSSKRQGRHTQQKILKSPSHMDLPSPELSLQPSSHKSNALLTELPGLLSDAAT